MFKEKIEKQTNEVDNQTVDQLKKTPIENLKNVADNVFKKNSKISNMCRKYLNDESKINSNKDIELALKYF